MSRYAYIKRGCDLAAESGAINGKLKFTILGQLSDIETLAVGTGIRDRQRLERIYGKGRWKKKKGIGDIKLEAGETVKAEIHWYEAHGIGKIEHKVKRLI